MLRWHWKLFGDGVQLSVVKGNTPGRFDVARLIARVFPTEKAFVDTLVAQGLAPASNFPAGPYPDDKIERRGPRLVEYTTAPKAEGLGTDSYLRPNSAPISGAVMLTGKTPDALHLSVRLAYDTNHLTRVILEETERENAQ